MRLTQFFLSLRRITTYLLAIVLGALFLDETMAARDFAGLALIALGLAAVDGRLFAFFRRPALA